MLNPNGTYVSVQSVHGSVTESSSKDRDSSRWWMDYGRQGSDEHNQARQSTAHVGVSHTHGVWAAARYRCALCKLPVAYLVYLWAMCP